MRFRLIRICKGEAISAIPQDVVRYDLKASIPTLVQNGYEVEDRDMMLVTKRTGIEITVYVNGRLMISPMDDKESAKSMADSFYPLLTEEID
jgi:ArsR family metal-binding transcriptional regulator